MSPLNPIRKFSPSHKANFNPRGQKVRKILHEIRQCGVVLYHAVVKLSLDNSVRVRLIYLFLIQFGISQTAYGIQFLVLNPFGTELPLERIK